MSRHVFVGEDPAALRVLVSGVPVPTRREGHQPAPLAAARPPETCSLGAAPVAVLSQEQVPFPAGLDYRDVSARPLGAVVRVSAMGRSLECGRQRCSDERPGHVLVTEASILLCVCGDLLILVRQADWDLCRDPRQVS